LHHDNAPSHTSFFTTEFFLPKNKVIVVTYPPYFFLFPQLTIKLKGRHFGTTEVVDAESQAVLNTLTEHGFQDAFKKWQKRWERCNILAEEDYFEGNGGQWAQSYWDQ
jgi:hypothetical protein